MSRSALRARSSGPLLAAMLAAGIGCGGAEPPRWEPARPNVILIVVDTLRRDPLGVYGSSAGLTPSMDAFARDAVRYDHAYAQAPWTTPSMGSLMASRYPQTLGIARRQSAVPQDPILLAEALQAGGYDTGAVVSNMLCSSRWNFDQGFASFDESTAGGFEDATAAKVTDLAIDFVDRTREAPFFLWVHYFDPHFLYLLHPEFVPASSYRGRINDDLRYQRLVELQESGLTDADVAELRRRYDSEVGYTDRELGRFLEHLRASGVYDDAVIVLTSDHGEAFLEHGDDIGHGRWLYEYLVRVPLLMKIPGVAPGAVTAPVQLVDVAPTVTERLGIPEPPTGFVGRSLLTNPDDLDPAPAFFSTLLEGDRRGVVSGPYKLTVEERSGVRTLIDLEEDPDETRDLAAASPEVVEALDGLLDAWAVQVREGRSEAVDLQLTTEEQERLEALGYVQ